MDATNVIIFAVAAVVVTIAVAVTALIAWYYVYVYTYAKRIFLYSFFATDQQIPLYITWLTAALIDTAGFLVRSASMLGQTIKEKVINRLPLIIGLVLLSFGAMAWTEYHDVYIQRGMDAYQCVVSWILYDLRLLTFLNLARLIYNLVWPLLRLYVRIVNYFIRGLPVIAFRCALADVLGGLALIGNGGFQFGGALADFTGGSGGVTENTIDATNAFQSITAGIEQIALSVSLCICEQIDFLFVIAFGWISHSSTVSILNSTTVFATDLALKIPVRTVTGTHPGTVPGVTADYGYIPNLEPLFDSLCEFTLGLGDLANRLVFLIVSELVGIFDDTIFVPGSPETVVLASNWIGFLAHAVCVLLEALRWVYRLIWAVVIVVVSVLATAFGGTPPVPILCDMREWRALLDFGGPTGLYYKDKRGIGGEVELTLDDLDELIDQISDPIVSDILVSALRGPTTVVVGAANFVLRFILHGIDSEFRMFNPPEPPRTGIPAMTWTPPTALPPTPTDCSTPLEPGNYFAWLQHYVDDPDGSHLLLVDEHLTTMASGFGQLGGLLLAEFGTLLESLILVPVYIYDLVVQTLPAVNIIFAETNANVALFQSRWRRLRYAQALSLVGDGLGGSIRELHPTTCTDPTDGVFCAIGTFFDDIFAFLDEVGTQIDYVFISARLEDYEMPDFQTAIARLEESAKGAASLLAIFVPPFMIGGESLFLVTADVLSGIVTGLAIFLTVPNYFLAQFQIVLDELKAGSAFTPDIVNAIFDWFINSANFVFTQIEDRACDASLDALLPAVGKFLDTLSPFGFYGAVLNGVCAILSVLRSFFQDFALEALGLVFKMLGAALGLIFDAEQDFGTRIGNFISALKDIVVFLVSEAPLFLLELFFGLIETLLPSPLDVIFAAVSRAIIGGLCFVLQFFITTAIGVLNFFGAGLEYVDLSCSFKRSEAQFTPQDDLMMASGRDALVEVMVGAYQDSSVVRRRVDRIRDFFHRKQNKRTTTTTTTTTTPNNASMPADNLESFVLANSSTYRDAQNHPHVQMSMDEALQAIAEFTEWEGNSFCDKLVLGIAHEGRAVSSLSLVESAHMEECVTKRALGEIVSILPYMHWFPTDGFYRPMAWLEFSMEAVRAYKIMTQFNQDRSLPRHVVLNDTYKQEWSAFRTDHLTSENYTYMINNMTIRDYFRRNDGNFEIYRGVIGLWNATREGGLRFGRYLDNVSKVLESSTRDGGPLEDWLYGADGEKFEEGEIPDHIRHRHKIWASMLRVVSSGYRVGREAYKAVVETNLTSNAVAAAAATPQAIKQGVEWMASEPTEEWKAAVKQRDEVLAQNGIYLDSVNDRVATSGIFGAAMQSRPGKSLRAWASDKMTRFVDKLKPNSPRALRNRQVLAQFFADAKRAVTAGFRPDDDGRYSYEPKYATGLTELDERGQPVAQLATCNTTFVPFCLDCAVLDGFFQQSVIGGLELVDYYELTLPRYSQLFEQTEDYFSDPNVNVCGGDGTQQIHFPSDLEITSTSTVFDILGGNGGALGGLIAFAQTELNNLLSSLGTASLASRARNAFGMPERRRLTGLERAGLHPAATESFMTDYLQNHEGFDPTYDGVSLFGDVSVITRAIDDFHSLLADFEFRLDDDPNPFGDGTIELPAFDSGSDGFFGRFFQAFISRDYAYSCARRNMTLLQGLFVFALVGAVLFFVLNALGNAVVPETVSTAISMIAVGTIVPLAFFVVVYGMPVQNLMATPLPVPPSCFANDVVDAVVCDLTPKCPAIVAGLVDGPYTEQNCRTCPFEPQIANCKRDYGVRHGFDVTLLTLEWWVPEIMESLRDDNGGLIASTLSLAGIDVTRYAGTDFSDKKTFDALVSCIGVMFLATIPVLALAFIVFDVTTSVLIDTIAGLVGKVATIANVTFLLVQAISNLLLYNLIYVVTPSERYRFMRGVRRTVKRQDEPGLRGLSSFVFSAEGLQQATSRGMRYVDDALGLSRIFAGTPIERRIPRPAARKRSPSHDDNEAELQLRAERHGLRRRRRGQHKPQQMRALSSTD